jgi:hypothetical protein
MLVWIRRISQLVKQRTDIDKWQAAEEVVGVGAEGDTIADHHLDYSKGNFTFRIVLVSRLTRSRLLGMWDLMDLVDHLDLEEEASTSSA